MTVVLGCAVGHMIRQWCGCVVYMGRKYGQGYMCRCATHITKVFVNRAVLFLQWMHYVEEMNVMCISWDVASHIMFWSSSGINKSIVWRDIDAFINTLYLLSSGVSILTRGNVHTCLSLYTALFLLPVARWCYHPTAHAPTHLPMITV